jgi:hypothetical protein
MKLFLAAVVFLVLGLGLGWYFEHHRAEREKSEIVQLMLEGIESSNAEHAARAVRAIQFMESNQPQEAVRLLSGPIAYYYSVYGESSVNERRSKVRALIEGLAKTNQVVAARIAEAATNSQRKAP